LETSFRAPRIHLISAFDLVPSGTSQTPNIVARR
jgi:hypothetical protein